MYGLKYVWVIYIFDSFGWWNWKFKNVNCMVEEVNKVVNGIFYINYMWFSSLKRVIVVGMVR